MTPEQSERLDAIHRALARLARRQDEMEARLARLEGSPVSPVTPAAAPPAPVMPERVLDQAPSPPEIPPAAPAAWTAEPPPRRNLEAAFGLTWVSRIAVVTVVLALAFFFQYAFERRWISETVRVLLGVGCGGAALALGERFWRTGQGVYGQALAAAGIAFLYLSFWAAFGLYHLIPEAAAFALMAFTTALAGVLASRYRAPAMAALGLAGGYATPLLLSGAQQAWFVLGYTLVLSMGAALAARVGRWRWLEVLALAGTLALYISQIPAPDELRWLYTLFILAYYGVFSASAFQPVFLLAQLLPGMAISGLWAPSAGALWAGGAIAGAGLAIAHRRDRWPLAAGAAFAGFWAAYGIWRLQAGLGESVAPVFAALTASYLLFLAWPVWAAARRRPLGLTELALATLNAAFYFGDSSGLLQGRYRAWMGLFAVAVALAQMAAARLLWTRDPRGAVLSGGIAWIFLVLAAPIQFAGYRVTMAWALEAAAAAWIGIRLRDRRAVHAAAAIFILMAGRLFLVDSGMYPLRGDYPLIANARLLTFVVAAAALWAAAWWIRRGPLSGAAYVGGHAIMLCGLCLEAVSWSARAAATENFRSVASTAISVIAAAYAVLLVAGGAARGNAMTRVLGVALIGGVVVKLYLYDIWLLAAFYRMAAFAILGILLWVMSYLYSRYRESIGSWWRG